MFGKGIEKLEEYRNLIGSITKTFGECFSTPKVQENDSNKIFQNFEKLVKFVWYYKNCEGKERITRRS